MTSPLQQLTFTSNKDQDRQISVDVSEDGNGAKQVFINVLGLFTASESGNESQQDQRTSKKMKEYVTNIKENFHFCVRLLKTTLHH